MPALSAAAAPASRASGLAPARLRARFAAIACALASAAGTACDGGPAPRALAAEPARTVESHRPGDLALDYVTDQRFPSLLVEVDAIAGVRPSWAALEGLREVLARRLGKPGGVTIVLDDVAIPPRAASAYGEADLRDLERAYRRHWTGDAQNRDRAVIWAIYVDRPFAPARAADGHADALALALGGSQIALFAPELDEAFAGADLLAREHAEALVLLHEVGHLCGLVNNGLPMAEDHEDLLHPFHDEDPGCVMHYRIEQGWLDQAVPLDLGYGCRVDLYMVGGPDPGAPADEPIAAVEEMRAP